MTRARTAAEWMARFNLTMTLVWMTLVIPTLLWWKQSILWIALMSVYANIVGHWSAYQGSRAGVKAEQGAPSEPDPVAAP